MVSITTSRRIFAAEVIAIVLPGVGLTSLLALMLLNDALFTDEQVAVKAVAISVAGLTAMIVGVYLSVRFLFGGKQSLDATSIWWWVGLLPAAFPLWVLSDLLYTMHDFSMLFIGTFQMGFGLLIPLTHLLLERFVRTRSFATAFTQKVAG